MFKLFLLFLLFVLCCCGNILGPISTLKPMLPSLLHPFDPLIPIEQLGPVPTNKFWNNLYLPPGAVHPNPVHVHPYVIRNLFMYPRGIGIRQQFNFDDKVGGITPPRQEEFSDGRIEYYYNVIVDDIGFSSEGIINNPESTSTITEHNDFGCTLKLEGGGGSITFPIIRGMAYVTAIYENSIPVIFTSTEFLSINDVTSGTVTGDRFIILTEQFKVKDGPVSYQKWILYSLNGTITLEIKDKILSAQSLYTGVLRIAKITDPISVELYDNYKSVIPLKGTLNIPDEDKPGYQFVWTTKGNGGLLHFAFPHHQDILKTAVPTTLKLWSTTKGEMVAYVGKIWDLQETPAPDIDFYMENDVPLEFQKQLNHFLINDLNTIKEEMEIAKNNASNYFAGKTITKIANICLLSAKFNDIDPVLEVRCVNYLKEVMSVFIEGHNYNYLIYDDTWGGVAGNIGITCPPEVTDECSVFDFGSSFYNDHHYHYGYFLYPAAVLAYLDKEWAIQNKEWVEYLIRDVANPSYDDPYFPVFRAFDWYSGHSWSQGLFPSGDSKDQESTSEELNFHYSMVLWGLATGNPRFVKLGRIMYSVAKRSIQKYFLMDRNNKIHPPEFVRNKVTGIFFENKAHYTTWFGYNLEYIHGIQMLPFLPVTEDVRTYEFVKDEWDTLVGPVAVTLENSNSWKSILYLNYATVDKLAAWEVMTDETLRLDDGLYRSWALYTIACRKEHSNK